MPPTSLLEQQWRRWQTVPTYRLFSNEWYRSYPSCTPKILYGGRCSSGTPETSNVILYTSVIKGHFQRTGNAPSIDNVPAVHGALQAGTILAAGCPAADDGALGS